MRSPRGLLEREEVVLLAVLIGLVIGLSVLFVVFRAQSETVTGGGQVSSSSRTAQSTGRTGTAYRSSVKIPPHAPQVKVEESACTTISTRS